VIRKGVARGVHEGHFGYATGPKPALSADGTYQVTLDRVHFKVEVPEDEIDLDSGFLMLPQAIPKPAVPTGPGSTNAPAGDGPTILPTGGGSVETTTHPGVVSPGETVSTVKPAIDQTVELTFSANREALYSAWNAMANLADLAGTVTVTIRAQSEKGFDRAKLQNGVLEPLREADLIE